MLILIQMLKRFLNDVNSERILLECIDFDFLFLWKLFIVFPCIALIFLKRIYSNFTGSLSNEGIFLVPNGITFFPS